MKPKRTLSHVLMLSVMAAATAASARQPENDPEPRKPPPLTREEHDILRNRDLLENMDLLKNLDKCRLLDLLMANPDAEEDDAAPEAGKEGQKKS